MLEVGSGYSTLWYSQFVKSYVSIEHDQAWYQIVNKLIQDGNRNISYNLAAVEWPSNSVEAIEVQFQDYLNKVEEVSQGRLWDVVLDDGRARVGVAQRVLKYLKPDSRVIIHDFWNRKGYHSVLQSYQVVAGVLDGQSIVVLKPKLAKA
eukprot:TRINITY_DN600_c0_g1_i2.p1 TRINITY_DN600_c0_g1~~TRINITY_DN600_c0_g1_i2.p1  ORF type:complete len:149 (+),score=18.12 TRINITY_DN600_c0_g1_i2:298-744(+)